MNLLPVITSSVFPEICPDSSLWAVCDQMLLMRSLINEPSSVHITADGGRKSVKESLISSIEMSWILGIIETCF